MLWWKNKKWTGNNKARESESKLTSKMFKSMKFLHAVVNTFHQNFDDMIMKLCVSYTGRLMITIMIGAFTVLRSLFLDHIVEISKWYYSGFGYILRILECDILWFWLYIKDPGMRHSLNLLVISCRSVATLATGLHPNFFMIGELQTCS